MQECNLGQVVTPIDSNHVELRTHYASHDCYLSNEFWAGGLELPSAANSPPPLGDGRGVHALNT